MGTFLLLGGRVSVVGDGLIVYFWQMHMPPCGLLLRQPIAIGLQTELQQPVWLSLFLGDEPHHILVQSLLYNFSVYISGEAEFVFLLRDATYKLILLRPVPLSVSLSAHSFFFVGLIV